VCPTSATDSLAYERIAVESGDIVSRARRSSHRVRDELKIKEIA
jgi:hypothetical protein